MCRVAILVSTETAAKDALLLTSAKKHPTQFCFSSRLQWTSRFYVEAQLEFRTLLFVPRRAPVVLFESNQEPNSDFHQTTYLDCYLQQWTHQRAILMAHRSFRFQVVPMETCLTILYRVHRYLLKSAIIVCLMRHTAVQTSAAEVFWRWRPHFSSQFQIHCSLSLVLIHLTIANLLLSIHGFSTTDCRGSGPRQTCLSSSTLSRRPSFSSIWGLHSYPSCGTPEVSILTFKWLLCLPCNMEFTHRDCRFCITVEINLEVVVSFPSSSGSEAESSLLTVPNGDSGIFEISHCPVCF